MRKKGNRRVRGDRKPTRGATAKRGKAAARPRIDPAERKVRNRTFLFLGLLTLVNAYVFVWRGDVSLADLGQTRAAAIGATAGAPLGTHADAPRDACTDDPTRIFAGLDGLLHQEAAVDATFAAALTRLGVDAPQIAAIEAAIRPSLDLGLVAGRGAPLRIASDRHGAVQALELGLAEGQLLQACRARGGDFQIRTLHHPAAIDVATIDLELGATADLGAAIKAAGEAPELAQRLAEVLAHDIDLQTEVRAGDRLRVIIEKRLLGDRFHRYGEILGLRYQGAAGKLTAIRYQGERGAAYYSPEGLPLARALRRSPLAFHAIPADARGLLDPTIEVVTGRLGAMYRRPEGAPVIALADGVVRRAEPIGDAGLSLEIVHPGGLVVRYSHLARLVGAREPATTVRAGELVGLAGHTGKTAGDRVRVEIWREQDGAEAFLDPLMIRALGDGRPERVGEPLTGDALARFEDDSALLRRALR